MSLEEKAEAAKEVIQTQMDQLVELVEEARRSDDHNAGFERLKRWKARTVARLREEVHTNEGERLNEKKKMSFRMGDPIGNLVDEARMYHGFLEALQKEIVEHPADVLDVPTPAAAVHKDVEVPRAPDTGAVFIVHGHDELNLLRLKEVVRDRWRLDPIVLSAEPGRGRTLIEKFEEEAQRASFAFVLLTPDDEVETSTGSYTQARPNVVFELGWFYGRLGRDRVCIVFKSGTRIHSDLDGVSRVQFDESVEEVTHGMERELVEAGVLMD